MPTAKKSARRGSGESAPSVFRLLAGLHIQADPDWEPSAEDLAKAEMTGVAPRAPSRTYKAGDKVPCCDDLVAKFGAEKFQLVSGEQGEKYPKQNAAPGGQVSEGFQVSSGTAETPEDAADPRVKAEDARDAVRLAAGPGAAEAFPDEPPAKKSKAPPEKETEKEEEITEADLGKMTKKDLQAVAADNNVDLTGCHTKEDMIDRIMGR